MNQTSLFGMASYSPLAETLRPQQIDAVVGQRVLDDPHSPLRAMIESGRYHSLILWGPPGCGKTTIARLLGEAEGYELVSLSAVQSGVAELKKQFDAARQRRAHGTQTLLFVDEIHRFNRAQQDAFLPVLEDGTVILIGATTENPSFELNAALLSRCQVVVLSRLSDAALQQILARAQAHYGRVLPLTDEAKESLLAMADGDGRYLLTLVEMLMQQPSETPLDTQELLARMPKRMPLYDKAQEAHYNLISALHKSLRGSDVDAALYWFARMLSSGENPLYIARRLVRFAVEDIGMADPQALLQAQAATQAYEQLGSPEGDLALAQAVIYLGTAPKSNAQYTAFKAAMKSAQAHGSLMPPAHILNAPTQLMKNLGYGAGYAYDHDAADGFSGQNYFPDAMKREGYYNPREIGFEREVQKRLDYWSKLRSKKQPATAKEPQS